MANERSGAEELFEQILSAGWVGLEAWREAGRAEDFLLEFKGFGRDAPKLNAFDKANIGKAVSGFANASGGVLIIGVSTKTFDGADHIARLTPAPNVEAYVGAINTHLAQCTDPRVPGARAEALAKPNSNGAGVVAIVVPASDGGPHRAKLAKWTNDKGESFDFTDKYFHRQATQTLVLEHPLLAAMFGRRPAPKLVLRVAGTERNADKFGIWVRNIGRGVAREVFLRVGVFGGDPDLATAFKRSPLLDEEEYSAEGWHGVAHRRETRDYGLRPLVLSDPPLYSGDEALAVYFRRNAFNYFRIVARIDAEAMQPVSVSAIWKPYDDEPLGDDGRRDINLFSGEMV